MTSMRLAFTELMGHAPIEISNIICYFLRADERNRVNVQVTGKRKREVGLVVPARYHMYTGDIRCAAEHGVGKNKNNVSYA